ncbi:cell division protein ZapB [Nitrincola sp. MINF-07-Sa-05]|uniref:cell division protein ZapB n=1 Tax=Nitrincola salilacus TaxID=3400273 RepID=UPI0039185A4D
MQAELFSQLETKIESLIEEVELLRLEISELRDIRKVLESNKAQTDDRLKNLLSKFDRLEDSADL